MHSSSASSPFRLELGPSRWPQAAIIALALLALLSLALSEAPAWLALALSGSVLAYGLWAVSRERRRPIRKLLLPAEGPVRIDGEPVEAFTVDWRGPLAFLSWRDQRGCTQRHALWPDTLPPALRRELRLAAEALRAGR